MIENNCLRILLVDDEPIVHQTISPYLKDCGHCVENAAEGHTALKLIEGNDYDLALINIRMPGMDGLALLSKIEKIRPELSPIIITGHGNMETVIQALRLGAVDFLTKPIKLLELDAVLEKSIRILRQSHRRVKETLSRIQTSEDIRLRNRCFIGVSKAMIDVRKQIQLAVEAQCQTLLICGETGTGKEIGNRSRAMISVLFRTQ